MVERVLEAITISKDTLQPYVDVLKTYFKESENIQVKEKLSKKGLEPSQISPHAPQTCAYTIPPLRHYIYIKSFFIFSQ